MIFEDDNKAELWFVPHGGGVQVLVKEQSRDVAAFHVPSGLFPDVVREIHEKAGKAAPVMIGRPDVSAGRESFRGLRVERATDGDGVSFSIGGNKETLAAHMTRAMAAYAVALADSPEPDDDDVFELAAVLARHPSATFPELARAVLADGRFGRTDGNRD